MHDRYPAYVTWETFERIEAILAENYATYGQNKRRGIPRQGAAMLQGLVYCGRRGHKMAVQDKRGTPNSCNYLPSQSQTPGCQRLRPHPAGQPAIAASFAALAPPPLAL